MLAAILAAAVLGGIALAATAHRPQPKPVRIKAKNRKDPRRR